jgi:23S rRNA pseudouridine1911/1915/1917 synthase
MLHARTLGFTHPVTGKAEDFTRSMPGDIQLVMQALEQFITSDKKTRRPVADLHVPEDAC